MTVSPDDEPTRSSFADARTALTFKGSALVTAHVFLKTIRNGPELIAHEVEHILEQLDGVDLQAQAGNGAVWKSERASYETRRAIEAGRRVAREVMDGARANRDLGSAENSTTTVKLQDRDATPGSPRPARVSADGRYVVFISLARLSENDRNSFRDVYVTDMVSRHTTLESVALSGLAGNGESIRADISGDGRYVVFESEAGDLTSTSTSSATAQIFLRDRADGTTRLLTTTVQGQPASGPSRNPVINGDATVVAFESAATDLIESAGTSHPGAVGIYVFSLADKARARLDVGPGAHSVVGSMSPAISADGRRVVFASKVDVSCQRVAPCSTLPSGRNRVTDIYLYDAAAKTTTRISRDWSGGDANGPSYDPAISGNGRVVAFVSEATNLTRDSSGRGPQVYLHDLSSRTTTLVSRSLSGRPANGNSLRPALSFDGSTLVFQSLATNLECERKCPPALDDINLLWDVFAYDARAGRTVRISAGGGEEWMADSRGPAIDDAGRIVAFGSRHPIDEHDVTNDEDLYVVEIEPARSVSARRF